MQTPNSLSGMRSPDVTDVICGLFVTALMFRLQFEEGLDRLGLPEVGDSSVAALAVTVDMHGDVAEAAMDATLEAFTLQRSVLQAMRLPTEMYRPRVLIAIARHIAEHSDEIDWKDVSYHLLDSMYGIESINHMLEDKLGYPMNRMPPELIRDYVTALHLAFGRWEHDYFSSSNGAYVYTRAWVTMFDHSDELLKRLMDVGVYPRDDTENRLAVSNLQVGRYGLFEAFCIFTSLPLEAARVWEAQQVVYGNVDYEGLIDRINRMLPSIGPVDGTSLEYAGAIVCGYPVRQTNHLQGPLTSLVSQIESGVADSELLLVHSLIETIAPLLFMEMSNHQTKGGKWRGLRLDPNYEQTMQNLDHNVGQCWWPLVVKEVSRFVNHEDLSSQRKDVCLAFKLRNMVPDTRRYLYLVSTLCSLIQDDFYRENLFN